MLQASRTVGAGVRLGEPRRCFGLGGMQEGVEFGGELGAEPGDFANCFCCRGAEAIDVAEVREERGAAHAAEAGEVVEHGLADFLRAQIGAALKAFLALGVEPPAMIGLAKKMETIIFPDERPPLNLALTHPGLQLLQRLRDEAHRFANTYSADLRSKKIRESVLDDFPGLGEVRRAALLAHFGDIEKLRAASAEKIREVPGFGPKLAAELHAFLHGITLPPAGPA